MLLLAVGCGTSDDDTGPIAETTATEATNADDSEVTSVGSSETSDPEPGVCGPIDDEVLGEPTVAVTIRNDTTVAVLVHPGPPVESGMCGPAYLVESPTDGRASSTYTCGGYCSALGSDQDCSDDCGGGNPGVLLTPGATFAMFPWDRRLWQLQPSPEECIAEFEDECFHGTTALEGDLQVSIWWSECQGECQCPEGEAACLQVAEVSEPTVAIQEFTADAASVEIVIDG